MLWPPTALPLPAGKHAARVAAEHRSNALLIFSSPLRARPVTLICLGMGDVRRRPGLPREGVIVPVCPLPKGDDWLPAPQAECEQETAEEIVTNRE